MTTFMTTSEISRLVRQFACCLIIGFSLSAISIDSASAQSQNAPGKFTTAITAPFSVQDTTSAPLSFEPPKVQWCVTNHSEFCDSVFLIAPDLLNDTAGRDTIWLVSLDPHDTVTPSMLTNPLSNDTVKLQICGRFDEDNAYFLQHPPVPEEVRIQATDSKGNSDTLTYPVYIGDVPQFECAINVSNATDSSHSTADVQTLCFGAGARGTDGVDTQYCESPVSYGVPPPNRFDARWVLPGSNGPNSSLVDVRIDTEKAITWQFTFQSGSTSGAGNLFPVMLTWMPSFLDPSKLRGYYRTGNFYLRNPSNPNEFSINMFTGSGPIDNSLYTFMRLGSNLMGLQIRDQSLENALILFVYGPSDVEESTPPALFELGPNYPNPFSSGTSMNFSIPELATVTIDIFDLRGRFVRRLIEETLNAGEYPVSWDGLDASGKPVAQGQYVVQMTAGSYSCSKDLSLVRSAK
jgi:hypothetical protein